MVATISPWNLPLYLFTWKIAPALAAGNTVVAKPSEVTPLTATMLGELAAQIGFPKGVLNIVHGLGPEVGEPLVTHPRVKAISFTGSTAVGKRIAGLAAPLLKKVSLELGGKNPTLVFADSDWRASLDTIVRSAFQNSGQICLCGSRILVERRIYTEFRDALVERALALRVGDPIDEDNNLGPLVSQAHFDKVVAAIDRARDEGGHVLCGGSALDRPGWFVAPTVIEGLGPECAQQSRGDLRSGGDAAAVRQRRGSAAARQRRRLRPRRVGVDARPRPRPSPRRAAARRHGLDQHLADARPAHAVRRRRRSPASAARAAWRPCASSPKPRTWESPLREPALR